LTPRIAAVDAEWNRAQSEREQISFDFATLVSVEEELTLKPARFDLLCIDDPASFERPLRVENLLFELWPRAMLAPPFAATVTPSHSGSTARPSKARVSQGLMTSFQSG
jgi:hypothetical protein